MDNQINGINNIHYWHWIIMNNYNILKEINNILDIGIKFQKKINNTYLNQIFNQYILIYLLSKKQSAQKILKEKKKLE